MHVSFVKYGIIQSKNIPLQKTVIKTTVIQILIDIIACQHYFLSNNKMSQQQAISILDQLTTLLGGVANKKASCEPLMRVNPRVELPWSEL